MKKLSILFIAFVVIASQANAQELKSKKGENYLPEKGDWSIGFNPSGLFKYVGNIFNGTDNNDAPNVDFLKTGVIVGKKFVTAHQANRAIVNLDINTGKIISPTYARDTAIPNPTVGESPILAPLICRTLTVTNSNFNVTLGVGKEYRKGKTRLQGFYGADVLLNIKSSKIDSATQYFKGPSALGFGDQSSYNKSDYIRSIAHTSGLGFGFTVQGFIGAEYFIFPKIAIGAQYNYGLTFNYQAYSKEIHKFTGIGIQGLPSASDAAAYYSDFTKQGPKDNRIGLGGVGVGSISMNFYF